MIGKRDPHFFAVIQFFKLKLFIMLGRGVFPLLPLVSSYGWMNNKTDAKQIHMRKRNTF